MGRFIEVCRRRGLNNQPLTLTRCHSCELQQLYEALKGQKSVCGQTLSNPPRFFDLHPRVSFPAYIFIILLSEVSVFERFEGGG